MSVTRAFSYVFDDPDWLMKLAIAFILTSLAAGLTPVLVGLALWAVMLGYQAELVQRVRAGAQYPLPRWDDFGEKLSQGASVLTAWILYNLPTLMIGGCLAFITPSTGFTTYTGVVGTLGSLCCLLPLLLIYTAVAWPVFALGMGRYNDSGSIGAFFQVAELVRLAREHQDISIQYVIQTLLANILLALLVIIPVVGWIALPALLIPVHGRLTGEYAGRVLGKPKNRPAPAAPRRR